MARWKPDGRGRLQQAAVELFSEKGFDQTTVTEIAARAGLVERTFFRHFTDKREVIFVGYPAVQEFLTDYLEKAESFDDPVDLVLAALKSSTELFPDIPDFTRKRRAIITLNAELQERELLKLASLAATIKESLCHRGVDSVTATLVSEAGISVFRVAFDAWAHRDGEKTFAACIQETFDRLVRSLTHASTPR